MYLAERRKAEARYKRRLNAIKKLIQKSLSGVTSLSSARQILHIIVNTKQFQKLAEDAARQMVTQLAVG